PPTWASGAGRSWATSPTWGSWRRPACSSPVAASACSCCRDRPPSGTGTLRPDSRGPEDRTQMNIVVSNVKGGVGKTTTAIYLAAVAARRGHGPILLVDADPQGSTA